MKKKIVTQSELESELEKRTKFKPGSKLHKKYLKTWRGELKDTPKRKDVRKTKINRKAKKNAAIQERIIKRFDQSHYGKKGALGRKLMPRIYTKEEEPEFLKKLKEAG